MPLTMEKRHERKIMEAGWFYHAPRKPTTGEMVAGPPISQIPILNGYYPDGPVDESRKGWIKDSDTAYIRLAKQGGRPDLLNPVAPSPKHEGPVGYPRNDWFYLEDNRLEDANRDEEQEEYVPGMPDYMVHRDCQMDVPTRPGALPNIRKPGCGVRLAKDPAQFQRQPPPIRAKAPAPETEQRAYSKMPEDDSNNANMSKLLTGSYGKEWFAKRNDWARENPPQPQEPIVENEAKKSRSKKKPGSRRK